MPYQLSKTGQQIDSELKAIDATTYANLAALQAISGLNHGIYATSDGNVYSYNGVFSLINAQVFSSLSAFAAALSGLLAGEYFVLTSTSKLTLIVNSGAASGSGSYSTLTALQTDASSGNLPDGDYLVGRRLFTSTSGVLSCDLGQKTLKVVSMGNSISALNQVSSNGYSADSYLDWFLSFGNVNWQRCKSVPKTLVNSGMGGNPNACTVDELGCLGWGSATLSEYNTSYAGSYLLPYVADFIACLKEKPDLLYLPALYENDIGANTTPNTSLVESDTLALINYWRSVFPDIIILIATPGPSTYYSTAAQQLAYRTVTSFVQSLQSTYNDLFVELNTSYTANTTTGQPILAAVSTGVGPHPNSYGARLRGKSLLTQIPFLVKQASLPTKDGTMDGVYVNDPLFTAIPASNLTATTQTALGSYWYYQNPTYSGGQLQMNVAPVANSLGLAVSIAALTAQPSAKQTATFKSNNYASNALTSSALSAVAANNIYVGIVQVQITNVTNLLDIIVKLIQNDSNNIGALASAAQDYTDNPNGMAGIVNGDIITFKTAPILSSGGGHLNISIQPVVTASVPVGFSTPANNPGFNVLLATIVKVDNNKPVALPVTTGAYTYTNISKGLQQVIYSGGTVSSVTLSADGGSTQITCSSSGQIVLQPGQILTINNTVVPTTCTMLQLS